jgi:glycerol-3-phosphate dehydrogenase subunit B
MLETLGVRVVRDRVRRVTSGEPVSVSLTRDAVPLTADAVVLALGGVAAGGVLYTPPDAAAAAGGRVPFALSLDAEVTLSAGGPARMDIVASTHGPELDAWAWPAGDRPGALEAVGVRCDEGRAAPGVFAAGDVVAGRPRTVLEAAASGVVAGARAAAREA